MLEWETPAVAQAAMDTGVAQAPIADMAAYKESLKARLADSRARVKAYVESYGCDF